MQGGVLREKPVKPILDLIEAEDVSNDELSLLWTTLIHEAEAQAESSPMVGPYIAKMLLGHATMDSALANLLVESLGDVIANPAELKKAFLALLMRDPGIKFQVMLDICSFYKRDPACERMYHVLLYYKGFQALLCHRIAHVYWKEGQSEPARYLNYLASRRFSVDIHPGARIAGGVFLDHGTGIVIGETAVVDRNVSIMQNVTLGGTGKETKDRHPKISEGVLIGAGAKLLGNIKVGAFSKVGAGTILLKETPPRVTVVGVPGKIVGKPKEDVPSNSMNQEIEGS
jgi:serine O-acetyltransferase